MRTGGFGNRLSSTRCAGWFLGRALRVLFACIIVAGAVDGTASAETCRLDSLSYRSDDTMLYIDFLLPMAALKSKELQAALDDNGLTIECVISIEVQRSQKFGSEVVSKKPILRTIKYSKWYSEYNLEEASKEIFTSASYYESMNRFRRFTRIPVIELCFLDPDQNHRVSLEMTVRGRPSAQDRSGGATKLAGMVPDAQGKAIADIAKLWRKKGDFFSVALESQEFTIETLKRLLSPAPSARGGKNP